MKKSWIPPITLAALIILGHITYFFLQNNFEFIGYSTIIIALFAFIIYTDKYYNYPLISIYLIAIWVATHSFGGSIYIKGIRLFDIVLINIAGDPYFILKYDNIAHVLSFFTIAIFIYTILRKHTKHKTTLIIMTILASSGVGAVYEIIEFTMVILFDVAEAVGGYYNTLLDLCFNFLGAILGALVSKKFQ